LEHHLSSVYWPHVRATGTAQGVCHCELPDVNCAAVNCDADTDALSEQAMGGNRSNGARTSISARPEHVTSTSASLPLRPAGMGSTSTSRQTADGKRSAEEYSQDSHGRHSSVPSIKFLKEQRRKLEPPTPSSDEQQVSVLCPDLPSDEFCFEARMFQN